MEIQQDFKELLRLFNVHRVEYLIVGGYALAFHGAPRYTGDMDLFVLADDQNAHRILGALGDFGFGSLGLKGEDFSSPDTVVQLGYPPVRIDIVTSLTGISFSEAFADRVSGTYGDVPVYYIARKHFILNKRASGRKKDFADIEALGED